MKRRGASILGLGTAAPDSGTTQLEALELALKLSPPGTDDLRRQVEMIYHRSGVETRATTASLSVTSSIESNGTAPDSFCPASLNHPFGPGTAARMTIYQRRAVPLAIASSRKALADAKVSGEEITHLVTASCTGFAAPGWDVQVIESLGLPKSTLRTNVGFMGCHAAINALRVAEAFASSRPDARVLVCCTEICSVHFRYNARPDQVVANALFADGSGAAVLGTSDSPQPKVSSSASKLIEGSEDQMGWAVGDNGFEMSLGIELPGTIRRHAAAWLKEWLGSEGLTIEEIGAWAVHPGGPKILGAVGEALGLQAHALDASKAVLSRHGNMSSPTVLFILEELKKQRELPLPCVMLSFGPGIAAEAILLR